MSCSYGIGFDPQSNLGLFATLDCVIVQILLMDPKFLLLVLVLVCVLMILRALLLVLLLTLNANAVAC